MSVEAEGYTAPLGWQTIRMSVLEHYGGKCACDVCDETDLRTLVLAYENIEELAVRERRRPGQSSQEYAYLYNHNFPQNGRVLLCRRCIRYTDTNHFKARCNFDHEGRGVHLPRPTAVNKQAVWAATAELERITGIPAVFQRPDMRIVSEIIHRGRTHQSLTDLEQAWLELFKKHQRRIYQKNRYHVLKAESKATVEKIQAQAAADKSPEGIPVHLMPYIDLEDETEEAEEYPDLSDWTPENSG